jgi:pilus assembly protein Flp/PilA
VERIAFTNILRDESGQDLIEYALVAALIGLGAIASMNSLAGAVSNAFRTMTTEFISAIGFRH